MQKRSWGHQQVHFRPHQLNQLKLNQWKNSDEVINWFSSFKNKNACTSTQMDIKEFYPSITESILINTLNFAKLHTTITTPQSLRKKQKQFFIAENFSCSSMMKLGRKKNTACFDVIGRFDGAEIC